MKSALHILTKPNDTLAEDVISKQRIQLEVVDLTKAEPDYKALLHKIFAADSIQVW